MLQVLVVLVAAVCVTMLVGPQVHQVKGIVAVTLVPTPAVAVAVHRLVVETAQLMVALVVLEQRLLFLVLP
jgi:hypothetical protein